MRLRHPRSTLFPYTTLFRSSRLKVFTIAYDGATNVVPTQARLTGIEATPVAAVLSRAPSRAVARAAAQLHRRVTRSEEHTSELQSRRDLVCRLLLEKKKKER